jgi:hypothetical protein
MDARAIVQDDAQVENVRAMIEATREFGAYGKPAVAEPPLPPSAGSSYLATDMSDWHTKRPPGTSFPWREKLAEIPSIERHRDMVEQVWNDVDGLANTFIWQLLVSF